ncbi:class I tRNA ligase family protein [Escherichia coli]
MARRSCQTALYHIAEALVRWMAPILSFTADEVWGYLPGEREKYVFTGVSGTKACLARQTVKR